MRAAKTTVPKTPVASHKVSRLNLLIVSLVTGALFYLLRLRSYQMDSEVATHLKFQQQNAPSKPRFASSEDRLIPSASKVLLGPVAESQRFPVPTKAIGFVAVRSKPATGFASHPANTGVRGHDFPAVVKLQEVHRGVPPPPSGGNSGN